MDVKPENCCTMDSGSAAIFILQLSPRIEVADNILQLGQRRSCFSFEGREG